MMEKQVRILITNDDGIHAPGIYSLWRALRHLSWVDPYIVAPAAERSGAGVSITWDRPILVRKVAWHDATPAWAIDGTPADCIKMGARVILEETPDLIVSGINAGSNAGRNVLHSGTIGACIEGAFRGIPGLALSCENGQQPNFHVAEKYVESLVRYLLEYPLPQGTLLNVNFPHAIEDRVKGFRLTRQGKGRWVEDPSFHLETDHGPSYWLRGKPEEYPEEEDCDIVWLKRGYMTAVPIYVHELTHQNELCQRQEEFTSYFNANGSKVS